MDFTAALLSYDSALALDPTDLNIFNSKAAALAKLDRPDEAIALCREALAVAIKHDKPKEQVAKVHQRLAEALTKKGDIKTGVSSKYCRFVAVLIIMKYLTPHCPPPTHSLFT